MIKLVFALVLAVLLLLASFAQADDSVEDRVKPDRLKGGFMVTENAAIMLSFHKEDCPRGTRAFVGVQFYLGTYSGCWKLKGEEVHLSITNGSTGYLAYSLFTFF